jgi:hypothetical protein
VTPSSSPALSAVYRAGPDPPAGSGVRAAGPVPDRIAVQDDAGRELLSAIAPPFVAPDALDRYGTVAKRRPGLDLVTEWRVRRWPGHGEATWVQVFRDGVEQDDAAVGDDVPRDLVIAADYRDVARFLVGAGTITNCGGHIRVAGGGVTELSCLNGLVLDETALRHVALSADARRLLAIGIATI